MSKDTPHIPSIAYIHTKTLKAPCCKIDRVAGVLPCALRLEWLSEMEVEVARDFASFLPSLLIALIIRLYAFHDPSQQGLLMLAFPLRWL